MLQAARSCRRGGFDTILRWGFVRLNPRDTLRMTRTDWTCPSLHYNFPLYSGIISDDGTCGEVKAAQGVLEDKTNGQHLAPWFYTKLYGEATEYLTTDSRRESK